MQRRLEDVDQNGRRRVILTEDPPLSIGDEVIGEEEVVEAPPEPWGVARGRLRTLVAFVAVALASVESLLAFRLVFLLIGANGANGFVDFIYDVSGALTHPFNGIVARKSFDGGVFEPATLIGMVVYAALAALVMALLWVASSAPSTTGQRAVTTRTRLRSPAAGGDAPPDEKIR